MVDCAGNYFKSFEDALKLHPQLGKASELFKRAAVSNTAGIADTTMFVPGARISIQTTTQHCNSKQDNTATVLAIANHMQLLELCVADMT